MRSQRYYDIHNLPDVRLRRDDDYVEAARALFVEAMRAVLQGFSRPAVSLSGGFDSLAVAAHAVREVGGSTVLGFTAVPEPGWDQRTSVRRFGGNRAHVEALAAMHPTLEPTWVDAAGVYFGHYQHELFLLAGAAPRNGMNLHWIHEIRSLAEAKGADLVLTGAMGSATFSFDGSGALPSMLRRGRLAQLLRELRAIHDIHSLPRRLLAYSGLPFFPRSMGCAVKLSQGWWAPSGAGSRPGARPIT